MKTLSKTAAKTLDILTDCLNNPGDSKKIDTSSYMAVHVECIGNAPEAGPFKGSPLFSVAHYFMQNGDMCCDPDMVFVRVNSGAYFPVSFQQAIPPVFQEAIDLRDGRYFPGRVRDLCSFSTTWMRNIKDQQDLRAVKKTPAPVVETVEAPAPVEAPAQSESVFHLSTGPQLSLAL